MLEYFRDGVKGPGFKILIAIIVLSFALFGVESVVSLGGNQSPLVINGEKISERRIAQEVQPQSVTSENELITRVENLIGTTLIAQQADDLNLSFSDRDLTSMIVQDPSFAGPDGVFDEQRFVQALQFAGYSPASYNDQMRRRMAAFQLQSAIFNSEFAVPSEVKIYAGLQEQLRDFRYHLISFDDIAANIEVTEQQIEDYYQQNASQFSLPERVQVSWVELTLDQLASEVDISDAEALEVFEAESARSERRDISHILLTGRDAEQQAQDALARLEAGESFADLARELSQDPGSANQGGQLGELMLDVFVSEFEQAALALSQEGQVSEPVETEFGVHLIRLDSFTIQRPDFATQREAIINRLARERVRLDFAVAVEQMANIAFTSDDLTELASAYDLTIRQSDWFTQDQARAGVAAYADARAAAFSSQVRQGENSDVIVVNDERAIVLRELQREEASVQPLDQVRDGIVDSLRAQQERELTRAAAEELKSQLESGDDLELDWRLAENYGRQDFSEDFALSHFVFSMTPPIQGQTSLGVTSVTNQGFALVELLAVNTPELSQEQLAERGPEVSANHANSAFQAWFIDMRSNARIRDRILN